MEMDFGNFGKEEVKLCAECDGKMRKLAKRLIGKKPDSDIAVFVAVPEKDGFPILADTMFVDDRAELFGAFVYAKSA